MGNVTALTRQGWLYGSTWGLIDDLVMTYEGNRLVKCDDAVSAQPTYNGVHHFTDLADEDEEYEYDGNGNMTKDLNREITSIEYNSLNLPEQITFYDGTKMKLTYDAAGNKLRAESWTIGTFNPGGPIGPASLGGGAEPQGGGIVGPILPPINQNDPQVVTDYCGNVIYRNDTLSMLLTDEGYVTFDERGEPLYHYYLKDHLGSVRVVLAGDGTVEQVNDYYPSGTLMYTSTNGTVQPYKFGGKELERTLPLDEYDFGARWMDPVVGGRFTTMDPMCEKYYSVSSYAYCHGDPLNWIDPDGRFQNVFTAAISNIWQKIRHPHQYVSNIIDHGDRIEPERQYTYTTVDYHSEEGITVTSHSKFDWDGVWADAKTSGETIQDIGNYATIVGLGISVICPAIGAPIAKFGDIISTIGQYISLLADIKLGNSADIVQDVISISLDAGTRKVRGLIDNLDDAEDMAKYILKFFSVSEEKLLNESVDKHIDNH
jgi:RHS repeat-associated protein